jgi:hypothetical protein
MVRSDDKWDDRAAKIKFPCYGDRLGTVPAYQLLSLGTTLPPLK